MQLLGYSIALLGLALYKLGVDKIKETHARLRVELWAGASKYPVLHKAAIATFAVVFLVFSLGRLHAGYGQVQNTWGNLNVEDESIFIIAESVVLL